MADANNTDTKNKKIRDQHNRELIRRMYNGESLTSYDSKASWYPPRPIIEKDTKEMTRVYGSYGPSNAAIKRDASEHEHEQNKPKVKTLKLTLLKG